MNLLNVLMKSMMTDGSINSLSQKTGVSSSQLHKLLPLAIPLLLKFLTKNASSQAGATSLLSALTQHTNTKPMEQQIAEADTVDGGKILAHILGGSSQSNIQALSGQTGMSQQDITNVLSGITPAMLSGLSAATSSGSQAGKVDLSDGLDLSELMTMLGGQQAQPQPSGGGLLSALFGSKPKPTAAEQDNALNGNALLQALLSQR